MSKQYYVENLSTETLAELTDEMIRFRKNAKNRKSSSNRLKIIPAIAAIVLVIGLASALPALLERINISGGSESVNPSTITIKGVEYSVDLTILDLSEMELTNDDIEPLQYMVNLTELILDGNQIGDISPLSGLTNLTKLGLFRNKITDIGPLAGLTNLEGLSLTDNQIDDISALSGLTNLSVLWLLGNQVDDIGPLAGLTKLTQLDLYGNPISDISPLAELTNLTFLGLANTQISDISPLAGLANLTFLGLANTQISDISPLVGLANLRTLYLMDSLVNYEQIEKLKEALPDIYEIRTQWLYG